MIIKSPTKVVDAIRRYFDNKDAYVLDLFWAGRVTSQADPGRPSVPNTIGTVLLNMATDEDYVPVDVLKDAMVLTGDRTLIVNRHRAVSNLLKEKHGDDSLFLSRRVKGSGSGEVLFPSEHLLTVQKNSIDLRLSREKDWKDKVGSDEVRSRSRVKLRELRLRRRQVEEVMEFLGYV